VLVVDDNSPDGTGQWCDQRARTEPRLKCLHRTGKLGLGSATLAAVRFAIDQRYDVLVTMDADWSHDPVHLLDLVSQTSKADVVVGSRYVSDGRIEGWPLTRRLVSRTLNGVSCFLLRLPVHDASGAFRAYRVEQLAKLELDAVRATGYAYLEEILWHLKNSGATFAEMPIVFRDRRAGRSKANWREARGKIATLLRLVSRRRS
jgi:dolichol-phosphate mannosyltransferase